MNAVGNCESAVAYVLLLKLHFESEAQRKWDYANPPAFAVENS
jgi:hypothetical protein